jgi:thymidylate kinase
VPAIRTFLGIPQTIVHPQILSENSEGFFERLKAAYLQIFDKKKNVLIIHNNKPYKI